MTIQEIDITNILQNKGGIVDKLEMGISKKVQIALYDAGCICDPVRIPYDILEDGTVQCIGCRKMGKVN